MIAEDEQANYENFRDCISELVISKLSPSADKAKKKRAVKGRKNEIKPVMRPAEQDESNDAEDLAEFVDYLASEIFISLPDDLRTLSYTAIQDDGELGTKYSVPLDGDVYETILNSLPPSAQDSLQTYGLLPMPSHPVDLPRLLEIPFISYITTAIAAPPEHTPSNRAPGCEICDREHLPLTYHHLIPRAVHAKAVKRGWAKGWELNKVAWLCRACHSFVHRVATNEELAKEWFSVERLMEREDVQKWAQWVGRVRWKAR